MQVLKVILCGEHEVNANVKKAQQPFIILMCSCSITNDLYVYELHMSVIWSLRVLFSYFSSVIVYGSKNWKDVQYFLI
jgi:hypothetical protein